MSTTPGSLSQRRKDAKISVTVVDPHCADSPPYVIEVDKKPFIRCSAAFRDAIENPGENDPNSITVQTTKRVFKTFLTWLTTHNNSIRLPWDKNQDIAHTEVTLIGLYFFASKDEIQVLKRDTMNCFLQRFADRWIPSENALLEVDKFRGERCHEAFGAITEFMVFMVMVFMPRISYESQTWKKLSDQFKYACYRYSTTRPEQIVMIPRTIEGARGFVLRDWCIWHDHVREEDGTYRDLQLVTACRRETDTMRKRWSPAKDRRLSLD